MGSHRRDLKQLLLVALPARVFACPCLAAVQSPTLVLMAEEDEFGTRRDLVDQFPDLAGHISVEEIRGADHFFKGQLALVQRKVRDWAGCPID